jgi:hypothetical protein
VTGRLVRAAFVACGCAGAAGPAAQAQPATAYPAPAGGASIMTPAPAVQFAPPAEVSGALPRARLVGRGLLRFFGLQVYDARLWAAPGFDASRYDTQPFALELVYARKLDGAAVAERSIAEMKRVGGFSAAQSKAWLATMTEAFPTLAAGDRLTGLHDGEGAVSFLHNGRPTAAVDDARFARLFFGIWLAPQSSSPALREALLGAGRDAASGAGARGPR